MLTLIGMGLWDEKDITLRGLEAAQECEILFLEDYTSRLLGTTKETLEKLLNKKIQLANRSFVESGEVLNYAKSNKVGLLVPGDPLVATTHVDIILRALEEKIKVSVVHNASIYSAVAETGLQIYKFGRSSTITIWEPNFEPTSFIDPLKTNKSKGWHTLFFLDLKTDRGKFMTATDALDTLLKAAERVGKKKIITENTRAVVCSQLGSTNAKISYGKIKDLMKADLGIPMHVVIIPGKLHPMEAQFLGRFRVASDEKREGKI